MWLVDLLVGLLLCCPAAAQEPLAGHLLALAEGLEEFPATMGGAYGQLQTQKAQEAAAKASAAAAARPAPALPTVPGDPVHAPAPAAAPARTGAGPMVVQGGTVAADAGDHFLCATMDWWPPTKCDYGVCSWTGASVLTADLNRKELRAIVSSMPGLILRIGGTQADTVTYAIGAAAGAPCPDFTPLPDDPRYFTGGCMKQERYDQIFEFCQATGCKVLFALNAMRGRDTGPFHRQDGGAGPGWDSSNAEELLKYTADRNLPLWGVEVGNEIAGAKVNAVDYPKTIAEVHRLLTTYFPGNKPKLVGPDARSWDQPFFAQFLPQVASMLDVVTWHNYPLGPSYKTKDPTQREVGNNGDLDNTIMTLTFQGTPMQTARQAMAQVKAVNPKLEVWMGESGGSFNSGRDQTSNSFINSFWFLDSVAGYANTGHSGFCRQTLLGGNYELVDKNTMQPNPDMWGMILYRQLMGQQVLTVAGATANIRMWAHCHPGRGGAVTLLLMNTGAADQQVNYKLEGAAKATAGTRLEYHVTAPNLHSRTVQLNGTPLSLGLNLKVPDFVNDPQLAGKVPGEQPLKLLPTSYAFVVLKDAGAAACA